MARVVDKALEKNRSGRQAEAAARLANEEPEDMELTLAAKPMPPLDTAAGLFDQAAKEKWGGINTAPSVFERTAALKTGTGKEE